MTSYVRAKKMHQYYRDVLSLNYELPSIGDIPSELVHLICRGSADTIFAIQTLYSVPSNLTPSSDQAIKLMLTIISQANLFLDRNVGGTQSKLPTVLANSIKDGLDRVLSIAPREEYLVVAIQLLYRLGKIDDVVSSCSANPGLVNRSTTLLSIMSMINIIEEKYEEALPFLLNLIEEKKAQALPLVSLMSMVCIYKLGGVPDIPVNFSTLNNEILPDGNLNFTKIEWIVKPQELGRTRPTVMIACDISYFYEHVVPLIYSINETNREELYVHLHCYNPNTNVEKTIKELALLFSGLKLTATRENLDAALETKVQYATRRFLIADYLINYLNSSLIICDADALFVGSWLSFFSDKAGLSDIIVSTSRYAPFWEKIAGGFLYLGGGDLSRKYIRETAKFIDQNLKCGNGIWFLDQIALSACFETYVDGSEAVFCSDSVIDISHDSNSLVWFVTTVKSGLSAYNTYKNQLREKYQLLAVES